MYNCCARTLARLSRPTNPIMLPEELQSLQARLVELEAENIDLRRRLAGSSEDAAAPAEATLRQSEANWRSLVENVPDYLMILDPDGTIRWINRVAPPGRPEDLVGRNVLEYATAATRPVVEQAFRTSLETRRIVDFTCETNVADQRIWYLGRVTALADAQTPGRLLVSALDITKEVLAEEEQRRLERKLQETQRLESLGVLAGGVAHDFNNLLTVILGNTSLSRMQTADGSAVHSFLDQVDQAALRAADLCRQMLAYAGHGRFVVAPLDLSALVSGSGTLLRSVVSKKATLRLNVAPVLPSVIADAAQVRQILMNLVINASEALDDREGTIVVETGVMHADASYLTAARSFTELSPGSYVFLEVRDNGCGMTAEVQGRIFDPFFSTKFTGRGLGLAAVLGIVRAHGGALRVLSEPGQGTSLRLLLRPSDATATERVAETPTPERHGPSVVLVVDDENAVRLLTVRLLKAAGFEVLEAADGQAAVEIYSREAARIHLVLLDLMMPHLDGEEALREMRRLRADVRAILMSGFSEQELSQRFADAPPAGYLQKPFTREQLLSLVARVLEP